MLPVHCGIARYKRDELGCGCIEVHVGMGVVIVNEKGS